jgi:dihydrofolate reductase
MTINGMVAGLNGENAWMTFNPDEEYMTFLNTNFDAADTILLGRKAAEGFINYWEDTLAKNPATPLAKKIVDTPKVVFTKTLYQSTWNNTSLAKGDLAVEIANLKNQAGKDILVLGGAGFVSSLIKENLIDEYNLIINPTAMSNGMTIFSSIEKIQQLAPTQAKLYPGGKIVLTYKANNNQ